MLHLRWFCCSGIVSALMVLPCLADPVPARNKQVPQHGNFTLSSVQGKRLASGELYQTVSGTRVMAHLVFRFDDGSVDDETTVFDQATTLRFLSDHHVQRGPSFPDPHEMTIDAASSTVTIQSLKGSPGKPRVEHMSIPADLANGMLPAVLQAVSPQSQQTTVSYIAATPRLRLLKLIITPASPHNADIGGATRSVQPYVIKAEIGGLSGFIAPMAGMQPPDFHADTLPGTPTRLLRLRVQLYFEGPLWTIEHTDNASPPH